MRYIALTASLIALLFCASVTAQEEVATDTVAADSLPGEMIAPPAPVTNLVARDKPDDHGHAITLSWDLSPDDTAGAQSVVQYEIFRWVPFYMDTVDELRSNLVRLRAQLDTASGEARGTLRTRRNEAKSAYFAAFERVAEVHTLYPKGGEWRRIGMVPMGLSSHDNVGAKEPESPDYMPDGSGYYYRVDAVGIDSTLRAEGPVTGPVYSSGQWFNVGRRPVFVGVVVFGFLTIFFVRRARRDADLYVRPISGIDAVDEAIGRATEMGRPILYVLGLGTAEQVATIASFTILGRVAKRVAEYQTSLIVPTYDAIVMSVAQEVVKSSYMDAGRPEAYSEDTVFFVTQSQFAYVAAVNGLMLRELPATNVYMGKFYAESLLLAETGAVAGSIQIAGTDEIAQIPFFIVACDYTLIGEELYAASAYLGREPILLGSLKAQDYAKAAVIILAIIGLITVQFGWTWFSSYFRVLS